MDEAGKKIRKKQFASNLQKTILGIIGASGILAVGLIAPGVFKAMKYSGLDKKLFRKKFVLNRSIDRLLAKGFLEFQEKNRGKFLILTNKGKSYLNTMMNSKDMLKQKRWDKKWRLVIFDIKEYKRHSRDKLRATLISIGFYRLQNSVWIYPYDCEDLIKLVKADLEIGKEILYVIADHVEYDVSIREYFGL
ncbi:MAG TPA: CRISPR-associated endonuclease Cas2 [Candidatus Paceibacterota bacterium]